MDWDPSNKLEHATYKAVKQCHGVGIWAMIWKAKGKAREVDGEGENEVDEHAWEVVRWLVELWEKDSKEVSCEQSPRPSKLGPANSRRISLRDVSGYSTMFVDQLSRPSVDLPPDNASALLDIARSAFPQASSSCAHSERVQLDLATRIFGLVSCPPSLALRPAQLTPRS